ncbi:MAG: PKD domain-containing protein [Bacteroidia bacterium]
MTKHSIFIFIVLLISLNSFSQNDTMRVLFLGNSYTAVNNLPQIIQDLASSANKTLIFEENTPGGNTLEQHSTNPISIDRIKQGNWDFIVLQEQSLVPTIDYYRYNSMYPAAKRLNDTIKKYNACARVVMYMTWGRRYGGQQCDQGAMNCSPVFVNFSHMQDSLESAYVGIANIINAYVSPVGIAWKKVIEDTSIVLHSGDDSHPNYNGSYLAACVFHSVIWDESPIGLTFTGTLSNSMATYFQTIADSTVFQSYSNWNLDVDDVEANFTFNTYGDSVQFINQSKYLAPVSYLWDFGDAQTSGTENPSHRYASNQTYTVSLVVEHCSNRDTSTQTVTINTSEVEHVKSKSLILVYPNPVISELEIKTPSGYFDLQVQLYNSNGSLIETYDIKDKQNMKLNLEYLPGGLYLLKLSNNKDNTHTTYKLMKH